jgi:ABC-type Fe3+-hydroxamate transport system substrate-binding protein
MSKRLTLYIHDDNVYNGLISLVGRGNISNFIENLIKPIVNKVPNLDELEQGYKQMAQDKDREKEAQEWVNNLSGDVGHEPW